jgi:vancomycin resistance protein YoaR
MPNEAEKRNEAPVEREATTPAPPEADVGPATGWRRWTRYAAVVLALVVLVFALDRAWYAGEVLRGVRVADVSLSGMDHDQAVAALGALQSRLEKTAVLVTVREQRFEVTADELGFVLDVEALTQEAMAVGRSGNVVQQLGGWMSRIVGAQVVAPHGSVAEGKLLPLAKKWAEQAITDPPFEGAVVVENGEPTAQLPRGGWGVDHHAAGELLAAAFADGGGASVELPLVETKPRRGAAALARAVARAKKLLAGDIVLSAAPPSDEALDDEAWLEHQKRAQVKAQQKKKGEQDDAGRFEAVVTPAVLAKALRSRLTDGDEPGIELELDAAALEPALGAARKLFDTPPQNARFVIDNKDGVHVRPGQPGRSVDVAKLAQMLVAMADRGERQGELPLLAGEAPTFATEAAEALGIKEKVAEFTTRHACCQSRVTNIHTIASLVDGVVLQPGQRFSINEHVGQRTKAKGFVPAPTIVHGKMKDTLGGGVSQFATTFFNAFFYAGYAIVERQPHSYYFSRYPMGHEATLSFPKPDVIVENDTKAGLLIRCITTPTTITVKLFGDNGGRKVRRKVSAPIELTDPPIEYIADRKLNPDRKKVKARGQKGWSIIVARITEFPDGTSKQEQRKVTYNPRVRKVKVHPCKIPKGEKGWTGERCPEPEEDDDDLDGGDDGDGVVEDVEGAVGLDELGSAAGPDEGN